MERIHNASYEAWLEALNNVITEMKRLK